MTRKLDELVGKALEETLDALDHADDVVALAKSKVKAATDARKARRETAEGEGYPLKILDLVRAERRKSPEQLRLDLEADELFRDELETYRAAVQEIGRYRAAGVDPPERGRTTPLEEAIAAAARAAAEEARRRASGPEFASEAGGALITICQHCGAIAGDPHKEDCARPPAPEAAADDGPSRAPFHVPPPAPPLLAPPTDDEAIGALEAEEPCEECGQGVDEDHAPTCPRAMGDADAPAEAL